MLPLPRAWWPLVALCVAALAPQAKKPSASSKVEVAPWNGTYEDALQRACDRNVPLVAIAIVEQDGQPLDSDIVTFQREIFSKPEWVQASPMYVVALAANRVHELTTIEVSDGETKTKKQVCSVYRTEGCQWHQKLFDAVYREHNVEGELRSPAVIVLGPDRKVAKTWMTGGAPAWSEIVQTCGEVQAKAGEGLTDAQLVEVRGLLARAAKEFEQSLAGGAYSSWSRVLAITTKTRYADEARVGQTKALDKLNDLREAARKSVAAGEFVEGYRALTELARQAAGTPLEKDLAKEILALEKDKKAKDAIAAFKREQEAERLCAEADALANDGESKKAETKWRQVLRKYGDTAAGKRVRDAHPDWAAEEDAKKQGGGASE